MPAEGVWIAYYGDFFGVRVYRTEIEALRACMDNKAEAVAFLPYGQHFGPGCQIVEGLVGGP